MIYEMPEKITSANSEIILKDILSKANSDLTFDMKKTVYTSSAGIRIILFTYKTLSAKGYKLKLINVSPQVQKIFETVSISRFFDESGIETSNVKK